MSLNLRHHLCACLAVCALLAALAPTSARAQAISNPSFEANAFTVFPGYVSNNAAITGWTASPTDRAGLNPAAGNPFADNGTTPQGSNVAFLQSTTTNFPTSLSNNITGLVSGNVYQVTFRANRRSSTGTPNPTWSLNGEAFTNFTAAPAVSGTNAYYTNTGLFRATSSNAAVVLRNRTAGDSTVLIDDFSVANALLVTTNLNAGPGSLRQALLNANAVGGTNVIQLAPSLSGQTITLTSEIVVTASATLDASALFAGLTLAGSSSSNRLLSVASDATVVLRALSFNGGRGIGAAASGNGGALYNAGTVAAIGCSFYNNSAVGGLGGAIQNARTLALTNCSFSDNTASFGGSISSTGTNPVTWTHCTVAYSSATGVGGGIYVANPVTLAWSLVANNNVNGDAFASDADIFASGSSLTLSGSNLVRFLSGTYTGPSPLSAAPLLSSLLNRGGPTPTIELQSGSPALHSAAGSTLATDQRGLPRSAHGAPDLGAYEAQSDPSTPPETLVVTTPTDELDPIDDPGAGLSLREAVRGARSGALVTFSPAAFSGPTNAIAYSPSLGQIVLSDSITLSATNFTTGILLNADPGNNRHFRVEPGVTAALVRLTLTGGNGYPDNNVRGGAIFNAGTLALTECTVTNNASAEGFGGAILNNGTLRLLRSTFADNRALIAGGAINNFSATSLLVASNCTFTANRASLGGALQNASAGATAVMTHCTVFANQATNSSGGGINVAAGSVTVSNSIVAANLAPTGSNVNGTVLFTGGNLTNGNPLLGPLGPYGGPTATLALLSNSPALNAITASGAPADQRGFSRFGRPDLGAFERQFGPVTNITTLEDVAVVLEFTAASNLTAVAVTPGNPALVSSNAFVLGGSGTNRTLTVTPTAHQNGASTNTVADSASGESTSFVLTVLPVNDAPSFVAGPIQAVPTNSGPQTIPGWATAISPGPAEESTQTVTFLVTNSNPSFFTVAPTLSSNGTLTYTVAPGSTGVVTVNVQLQDNGGTANGGSDLSPVQSFTVFAYGADATQVSSLLDNGPGSLRRAITHAALIPGPNTITFHNDLASLPVRLITPYSNLVLDSSVTLDATGIGGLTLSGSDFTRLLTCNTGTTNLLRGLTFERGDDAVAGAILNYGTLTLERCWLTQNRGDGIDSTGAIRNEGTLTLDQCRLSENYCFDTVGLAGAIHNAGNLTLLRSTLEANITTSGAPGGINNSGNAVIQQSTLSDNFGGETGGLVNHGTASILHSTFVDNGITHNILNQGTLVLSNSIVAPGELGLIANLAGTGTVEYAATNIVSGDPLLADVGDYGGPVFVRPPLPGSPALDAAVGSTNVTDQRGCPIVGTADLGAAESPIIAPSPADGSARFTNDPSFSWTGPSGATFIVRLGSNQLSLPSVGSPAPATSSVFTATNAIPIPLAYWRVDATLGSNTFIGPVFTFQPDSLIVENTNASGYGSLTRLLSIAPPGYSITFATNLSGADIQLSFPVSPTNSFAMDASALPAGIRLVGSGSDPLFIFNDPTTNQFKRITFTGGAPALNNFLATLTAVDCLFISNQSLFGGASFNDSLFTLVRCTLIHNSAILGGGALYNYAGGTMHLVQCTLASNSAPVGGAIYNRGPLILTHSTVSGNSAIAEGGGIYRESTSQPNISVTLSNSIVAGNTAPTDPNLTAPFTAVQSLTNGNPLLGQIGLYGGFTPTLPLLTNSPARDAAIGSTNTTDQRGVPVFGVPDIGAFEARPPTNFLFWASETAGLPLDFGADSENDGGVNGLEYALRRNPLVRDAAILPALAGTNGGRTFTFNYRPTATDLRYIVQRSSNLTAWTEIYRNDLSTGIITRNGVTSTENATNQITTVTDPATGPVLHWRLRVEKP